MRSCYLSAIKLPSLMQNPSSVIDRKQRMLIWPAGYFTVIHFPEEDVTVLWDRKTTVHVQVGPGWQVGHRVRPSLCRSLAHFQYRVTPKLESANHQRTCREFLFLDRSTHHLQNNTASQAELCCCLSQF